MPQLSLTERIAESFTLSRAQRLAESTPEIVRRGVAEDLALSRQKADAAESLFDNGHPAEAIVLARQSLEQALVAVGHLGALRAADVSAQAGRERAKATEADPKATEADAKATEADAKATEADAKATEADAKPEEADAKTEDVVKDRATPTWRTLLAGRGAATDVLNAIDAVVTSTRTSPAPRLDGDVTPDHAAAFHRVLAARVAIDRELHPSALTVAQVQGKRRNRIALTAFVAIAAAAGLFFALRRPTGTYATASASFNGDYEPANAIDGRPDSEWLLPDRASGWLEINVGPPRRIEAVSLINACNLPHEDRATRDYTIEVWAHGELARSVEGTMPFSTARNAIRTEIGVDEVERVRVLVRSWHQNGGGLAEVRLE